MRPQGLSLAVAGHARAASARRRGAHVPDHGDAAQGRRRALPAARDRAARDPGAGPGPLHRQRCSRCSIDRDRASRSRRRTPEAAAPDASTDFDGGAAELLDRARASRGALQGRRDRPGVPRRAAPHLRRRARRDCSTKSSSKARGKPANSSPVSFPPPVDPPTSQNGMSSSSGIRAAAPPPPPPRRPPPPPPPRPCSSPSLGAGRAVVVAGARSASGAAAKQDHVRGHDLGRVALLALLVFPRARLQPALDVDCGPWRGSC